MNTLKAKSPLDLALSNIPAIFRGRIVKSYLELKSRHAENKHDAAGLSAGKFCECIVRLLQHELKLPVTPFGQQLTNISGECESFSRVSKAIGNDSLRIVIPRSISLLYTLRNKRGIGHVGGDVDANAIDGVTIARLADWTMCELIRIYHNLSLEEADALVGSLASRDIPDVWEVAGRKRVLRRDLDFKQKTLLLLYSAPESAILAEDLFEWSKYSDFSMYKKAVLLQLDRADLVDYDAATDSVILSPLGVKIVEDEILHEKDKVVAGRALKSTLRKRRGV